MPLYSSGHALPCRGCLLKSYTRSRTGNSPLDHRATSDTLSYTGSKIDERMGFGLNRERKRKAAETVLLRAGQSYLPGSSFALDLGPTAVPINHFAGGFLLRCQTKILNLESTLYECM
jgi:hypothetical protein